MLGTSPFTVLTLSLPLHTSPLRERGLTRAGLEVLVDEEALRALAHEGRLRVQTQLLAAVVLLRAVVHPCGHMGTARPSQAALGALALTPPAWPASRMSCLPICLFVCLLFSHFEEEEQEPLLCRECQRPSVQGWHHQLRPQGHEGAGAAVSHLEESKA